MRNDSRYSSSWRVLFTTRWLTLGLTLLLCACPRGPRSDGTLPHGDQGDGAGLEAPAEITDAIYLDQVRRLRAAPTTTSGRAALRDLLIGHLTVRFDRAMASREYEEAWEIFAEGLDLYQAEELRRGQVSDDLGVMAEALLAIYEPRGDEGRVLTALTVLTLTSEQPDTYAERYRQVAQWSTSARQALPSETERVIRLVRIFEQITSLMALQEPVEQLTDLYLERHRLLQAAFSGPPDLLSLLHPGSRAELQDLLSARGQTVADIVTLYLRAGRPQDARRAVSQLGNLMGHDRDLIQALRNLETERRRSEALVFLATNLGRERPDVALDLCHAGFREFPEDARFSVCLAELYRYLGDTEGALQYYEATLEADPSPENFEQVLHFMVLQLEERLNEEDSEGARDTYERTERVLQSFLEHHPNAQPPIREDQLTYLIGMGEFNVGNIDQAVERFEASVANRPNRLALIQLGVIAERRGEGEQAIRRYRAALDLNDGQEGEDPLSRAVVLTHLADAYTLAGNTDRARTMYNEALEMLRVAATTLPPESDPAIMMERGFILYKLGRTDEGAEELQRALSIAPQRRATYGQLLSFYVGRGMVDRSLEVFRLAFNHSELERSWKIYYSMWIVGLQRRLSLEPDAVALRYLESVEGQEWIDRLGRYFVGTLSYQELLDSTESQGQRAEVYYYEAVLELGRGNRDHAAHLLGQVIETNMLGYFEYEFARRLQEELSLTPPQSNASATR